MKEALYAGAYWQSRKETINEIADRTVNTLKDLAHFDPHFQTWYETDEDREKMLENKVVTDHEYISNLYQKDLEECTIDPLGYPSHMLALALATGQKRKEASYMTLMSGQVLERKMLSNSCVVSIPHQGAARERLLKTANAISFLQILITNWSPDYAFLTSFALSDQLSRDNEKHRVGWITYYKGIRTIPPLSDKFIVEKLHEGHLYYLNTASDSCNDHSLIEELHTLKQVIN